MKTTHKLPKFQPSEYSKQSQMLNVNMDQSRTRGKRVGNGLKDWKSYYVLYCHLVISGLILAMFLRSQSYDFDVIALTEAPSGVEWLC